MTQHVLWPLSPGRELAEAMQLDPRMLIVLHIGTNNLYRGNSTPEETRDGVIAVVGALLQSSKARVLVSSLFPFATSHECATSSTCASVY